MRLLHLRTTAQERERVRTSKSDLEPHYVGIVESSALKCGETCNCLELFEKVACLTTNEAEAAIVRPWRACLAFAATVALPLTAVIRFVPRHRGIVMREGPALGPSLRLVF